MNRQMKLKQWHNPSASTRHSPLDFVRPTLIAMLSAPLIAGADPLSAPSLGDMTIEQLMNEPVTSVSKKETRLSQSPAAVTVITQEDIRRSGMTTIPELLRMVPGLDVARIDGNEWAVSSRGFNNQFANKLLVLI